MQQLPFWLFTRSGVVTPRQVAKNIIAALKEVGKVDPNFQAIAQWNEEEIIKVCSVRGVLLVSWKRYSLNCVITGFGERVSSLVLKFSDLDFRVRFFVVYLFKVLFLYNNYNMCFISQISLCSDGWGIHSSLQKQTASLTLGWNSSVLKRRN